MLNAARLAALCCLSLVATQTTREAAQSEPPHLPAICVVCVCTEASNGQTSVHCTDAEAAFEVTRDDAWPIGLRSITLSHAHLSNLPRLPKQKLHTLSLAHNALLDVPDEALAAYDLAELNLGFNGLRELRNGMLRGNEKLRVLRVPHNSLTEFDWESVEHLKQLAELHLQDNYLSNLTGVPREMHELKILNLSGNSLSEFPTETCSGLVKLEELDLANNHFATIPECMQSHLGALQLLLLDGNKITKIGDASFTGLASLGTLSISGMSELREVHSGALKGLSSLEAFRCAGNKNLGRLDKTLFFMGENKMQQDWSIPLIDLSNNNFKKIPSDLVPWNMVEFVNLQGNPWDCGCDAQWMLDSLMPTLYKKNSSMLEEFRCTTPTFLASRRIVHWLGHKGKAFCEDGSGPETQVSLMTSGSSQGMLIALAVVAGVALLLLVLGFILQRRYERQRRDLATKMGQCRRPRNGNVRLTNPKYGI